MKTQDRNRLVTFLCDSAATAMVAGAESRDALQARARTNLARLRHSLGAEGMAPVEKMARVMRDLAEAMVACPDVDTLELVVEYAAAVKAGDVLIAAPEQLSEP